MPSQPIAGLLSLTIGALVLQCGPPQRDEAETGEALSIEKTADAVSQPVSRGESAALRAVEMRVTGAKGSEAQLRFELVFANVSRDAYALAGELGADALSLVDTSGGRHSPSRIDPALHRIDPGAGLAPGAQRQGAVIFPRPAGDAFELRLPGFGPLRIEAEQIETVARIETAELRSPARTSPPARAPLGGARESDSTEPDRSAPSGDFDAVRELLRGQASALERGDFDGYLGSFARDRWPAERIHFEQRRSLPITEVRLRLIRGTLQVDGPTAHGLVRVRYRLDGVPEDNPFVQLSRYSFSRSTAGWRVTEIADNGPLPVLWRRGELAVHRTNHFLIVTDPRFESDLVALARDAESAYATLYQRGLPMASGYVVHFLEEAELSRLIGRAGVPGVARSGYEITVDEMRVNSRTLYVNASHFSAAMRRRLTPERRLSTVTHELVHLALSGESRPYTPVWLAEGAAVYFSGDLSFDDSRRLVRRGMGHLDLVAMTRAGALGEHPVAEFQQADEYLFSGNVVAYLIEQRGAPELLRFYRSFANLSAEELLGAEGPDGRPVTLPEAVRALAGETKALLADAALRERYATTLRDLDLAVRAWLGEQHP